MKWEFKIFCWCQIFLKWVPQTVQNVKHFQPCKDTSGQFNNLITFCSNIRRIDCHSTWYTCHSTWFACHSTRYICHSTRYTCHSTWFACHSTRYTCHSTWYTCQRLPRTSFLIIKAKDSCLFQPQTCLFGQQLGTHVCLECRFARAILWKNVCSGLLWMTDLHHRLGR